MNSRTLRAASAIIISSLLVSACDASKPLDPSARGGTPDVAAARSASQPQAPSNTEATASSASQIDIHWKDNSTNETSFQVHRSTTGQTGAFSLLATVNVTSHNDSGLASAVQYCYKVRSARSAGNKTSYSEFSNTACATTLVAPPPPPPPPPLPASPNVTNATPYNGSTVFVEFLDNATNSEGFRAYRSFDGGTVWTMWAIVSSTSHFYDNSLASEQQVCYRLVAYNAGGESAPSNMACTTPPAPPANVTLRLLADGSAFELRWADNSAVEDGYEVRYTYRVNADGFPCGGDSFNADCSTVEEVVAVLGPTTTSYRFTQYYSSSYLVYTKSDGGFSYPAASTWVDP